MSEDRFDGFRSDMMDHPDETFNAVLERMRTERSSGYLFAQCVVAGPGWAHWDGDS